ncbi:hypothetical protein ACEXQB_000950 [Herbiconiux sp. P18]|uniref:hypothetical protein n=1 Tax=Herbiconiux liangxiaofengii TaxID=3342795 RepID=UPI0035B717E9
MRRTGGLLVIALVLGLTGCSADGSDDRYSDTKYDAMLEVEKVPGVLVAPYEHYVQVDPAASEQEIVTTALSVREILDGLGDDRPRDIELVAVYPGDSEVDTEFTTRVYDDDDRFERDVRVWAGLLDDGFTAVRFNVFDETGDGVLNVQSGEPGAPGPSVSESFDAMVGALGEDAASFVGLQTQAVVDGLLVTNRSGRAALPDGWGVALDRISTLEVGPRSSVDFDPDAATLRLKGATDLTAEQSAEIMAILTSAGVLRPALTVTYNTVGDDTLTTLYGAVE